MSLNTIEHTTILNIRVGDNIAIKEDSRVGQIVKVELTPNGADDLSIVAILTVKLKTGLFTATSDKFAAIPEEEYLERIYQ